MSLTVKETFSCFQVCFICDSPFSMWFTTSIKISLLSSGEAPSFPQRNYMFLAAALGCEQHRNHQRKTILCIFPSVSRWRLKGGEEEQWEASSDEPPAGPPAPAWPSTSRQCRTSQNQALLGLALEIAQHKPKKLFICLCCIQWETTTARTDSRWTVWAISFFSKNPPTHGDLGALGQHRVGDGTLWVTTWEGPIALSDANFYPKLPVRVPRRISSPEVFVSPLCLSGLSSNVTESTPSLSIMWMPRECGPDSGFGSLLLSCRGWRCRHKRGESGKPGMTWSQSK